ncbi:exonuclease domain-containing protein [Paenibacillus contaminans]|nr:exonuclease domain-containing protein [Paenibacillus contaminans]
MNDRGRLSKMWEYYKMGGLSPAITSLYNGKSAQQMAFIRSMMKEQRQRSLFDISLSGMEAVVFDLETTGFSPYHGDEIISIGAVSVIGSLVKEDETFYSEVNPERMIPDHIVELTGITNEQAAGAPSLMEALRYFLHFVQQKVLVVHGSGHDKRFLNSALWRTSKVNMTHRVLDTMMIAKWLRPASKCYGLDELLDAYGIEPMQRHHALYDAVMTAKLWSAMNEEISERGVATLGDLYVGLSHHEGMSPTR